MFAIIYGLFNVIGLTISGAIAGKDNYDCMKRAEERKRNNENPHNIYYDRKGAMRDLTTHKNVSIDYIGCESEGKDQYMRDMYGHPIKNLSEERRQQKIADAKAKNDSRITVVKIKDGITKNLAGRQGRPYYAGPIFKDLDNGKEYVCRHFDIPESIAGEKYIACSYYMDISTGLLVRESDSSKEMRRRGKVNPSEEIAKAFMNHFNTKQSSEGYIGKSKYPDPKNFDMNGNEKSLSKDIRMRNYYCNDNISYDLV